MWISMGYTNDEMANEMFITAETVKSHVRRILQKLEARNRANAVFIAVSLGWLTTSYEATELNLSRHSLYE